MYFGAHLLEKRFSEKKQRKMEDRKMQKSIFELMGGTYTRVGDYLLPNLTIDESEQQPIGKGQHIL